MDLEWEPGGLRLDQYMSEGSKGKPKWRRCPGIGGIQGWTHLFNYLAHPPPSSSPAGAEECPALLPTWHPGTASPRVCPGAATVRTHLHVSVLSQHWNEVSTGRHDLQQADLEIRKCKELTAKKIPSVRARRPPGSVVGDGGLSSSEPGTESYKQPPSLTRRWRPPIGQFSVAWPPNQGSQYWAILAPNCIPFKTYFWDR